jgi:hypothetical protein
MPVPVNATALSRASRPVALAHRPRILFTLDDCRAVFSIELCGKAVEVATAGLQSRHRRSHRIRLIIGFHRVDFIEPVEIVGDLPIEIGNFLGNLGVADDLLAARHRSKLRAVQGDQTRREQACIPAQPSRRPGTLLQSPCRCRAGSRRSS